MQNQLMTKVEKYIWIAVDGLSTVGVVLTTIAEAEGLKTPAWIALMASVCLNVARALQLKYFGKK